MTNHDGGSEGVEPWPWETDDEGSSNKDEFEYPFTETYDRLLEELPLWYEFGQWGRPTFLIDENEEPVIPRGESEVLHCLGGLGAKCCQTKLYLEREMIYNSGYRVDYVEFDGEEVPCKPPEAEVRQMVKDTDHARELSSIFRSNPEWRQIVHDKYILRHNTSKVLESVLEEYPTESSTVKEQALALNESGFDLYYYSSEVAFILDCTEGYIEQLGNGRHQEAEPTHRDRKAVFDAYGNACVRCGSTDHLHCHHIDPVANGGDGRRRNFAPLCKDCHLKAHGGSWSKETVYGGWNGFFEWSDSEPAFE